jgi:multidrug resistance efflux pump
MWSRATGIVLLACLLTAALYFNPWQSRRLKVSGFIEADEIRVGSRVGGRVRSVAAVEGAHVKKGDPLVELEPFDLQERRSEAASVQAERKAALDKMTAGFRTEEIAQAKARTEQLNAQLQKLKNGPRPQEIASAVAELESAKADLKLAQVKQERTEGLFGRGATTRDDLDQANSELASAQARLQVKQESLNLLREGTRQEDIEQAEAQLEEATQGWKLMTAGNREEDIAQARAGLATAEAGLAAIDRQLEELKIVAPVDGYVEAVELQPGDLVGTNSPAISLVDTANLWVRAYVPENHLDIQIDQDVAVTVDSFPGREFKGRITYISRQAEYTPGNVQTPEERSKQVFRIKVTLIDGRDVLRPGMAADVWLDSPGSAP